jgi:hypothetical protein
MKNVLIGFVCSIVFAQVGLCCDTQKVSCCEDVCCRKTVAERIAERRAERVCDRAQRVACREERRAARRCCCEAVCCNPCAVVAPVEKTAAPTSDSFSEAVANSTPCCGN